MFTLLSCQTPKMIMKEDLKWAIRLVLYSKSFVDMIDFREEQIKSASRWTEPGLTSMTINKESQEPMMIDWHEI